MSPWARCAASRSRTAHGSPRQVVGFHERGVLLMPLGDLEGIHPGATVRPLGRALYVRGRRRAGRPGARRPRAPDRRAGRHRARDPVRALRRAAAPARAQPHRRPLGTGVRAIDGLMTLGRGQRIGIMAGSGVGKSVLLGMIARRTTADVNVIALLGERGREVREFIERDLGPEGLRARWSWWRPATSPPSSARPGALVATAIAEYFRDAGKDRAADDGLGHPRRDGLARDRASPSASRPRPRAIRRRCSPHLPRLLERAGTGRRGSITGLYTVLVEGDDFNEPVADAARSILDGHIVLTPAARERRSTSRRSTCSRA